MAAPPSTAFIERCVEANRSPSVVGVDTAFLTIAILLVALRVYVRTYVTKSFAWDDVCIIVAIVSAIATFSVFLKEIELGAGHHVECIRPSNLVFLAKLEYIDQVLTVFTLMFARLSACILLLRLFTVRSAGRVVVYVLTGVILAMSIASICIIIPQCKPTAKLWNPKLPGKCWSPHVQLSVGYFNGAVSAFSDLAISILPIYFLWTVQMKRKLKIAVCAVMGLGVFTAACALVRTVLLEEIKSKDITYVIIPATIWAGLETRLGIIAAAAPPLRSLFMKENNRSGNSAPYESRQGLNQIPTNPRGTQYTKGSDREYTRFGTESGSSNEGFNKKDRSIERLEMGRMVDGRSYRTGLDSETTV